MLPTKKERTDCLMFKVDVHFEDKHKVLNSEFGPKTWDAESSTSVLDLNRELPTNRNMMNKLHIATLNCEGLKRSRDYLFNYLTDSSCDILCIQESWHLDDNEDVFGSIRHNYL